MEAAFIALPHQLQLFVHFFRCTLRVGDFKSPSLLTVDHYCGILISLSCFCVAFCRWALW